MDLLSRPITAVTMAVSVFAALDCRADFPPLALKPVSVAQITSPANITNAGDGSGRLFICDQAGYVYVIRDGMLLPAKFLDISAKLVPKAPTTYLFPLSTSYDERGLLGMAFHPNYSKKDNSNQPLPGFGKFYVFYSAPSPNPLGTSTISAISAGPSNPITVTTAAAHHLTTGDVVTISGVTGGNFSPSLNNGTFTVTVGGANDFTVPVNRLDNTSITLNGSSKVFPNQPVNCRTTISEFRVSTGNPDVADAAYERVLFAFDKPQNNHNGGQLQFGPDGLLYISVGDGGSQHDNDFGHTGGTTPGSTPNNTGNLGNAQDKTKLLGKILRIDPLGTNGPGGQYGVPGSPDPNPFVGAGGGVREEIYSFGMRNPWRFSFDDGAGGTNRLIEADVGQDTIEEVNIIVKGGNYGWRIKEGSFNHDSTAPSGGGSLVTPIAQYAHTGQAASNMGTPPLPQIGASVIGGYVYRGSAIPALNGKYVFGDYSPSINSANGTLLGLEEVPASSGNWVFSIPPIAGGNPLTTRIYAFGRDEQGELYVATKVSRGPFELDANGKPTGTIYKIVAANVSSVTLAPSQDNTIYSDFTSNSNALGDLFAGNNAGSNSRRALLAFDVSSLPAGAVVASATLSLHLNNSASASTANMSLYKLSQSWGEGTSLASPGGQGTAATTGDATWTARLYDPTSPTNWTPAAGGTYNTTPSATAAVGVTTGYYNWTSAQRATDVFYNSISGQLSTDVQGWFSSPATNFGWILLGDETTAPTAREFESREAAANLRPQLQIAFNAVLPPLTRRETWLRQYFPTPGTYVDDLADLDGDSISNLLEYAYAYSPLAANNTSGLQTSVAPSGANQTFTITFRRDPRATDLTYLLQTSDDLVNWTTIAQSTAGAVPTGTGFVSEADAPGEAPVKIVTASELVAAPARRFAQLKVIRTY